MPWLPEDDYMTGSGFGDCEITIRTSMKWFILCYIIVLAVAFMVGWLFYRTVWSTRSNMQGQSLRTGSFGGSALALKAPVSGYEAQYTPQAKDGFLAAFDNVTDQYIVPGVSFTNPDVKQLVANVSSSPSAANAAPQSSAVTSAKVVPTNPAAVAASSVPTSSFVNQPYGNGRI